MDNTTTDRTPLTALAKMVRRTPKDSGFKATVRCSGSSTHECLTVNVSAVPADLAACFLLDLDLLGGLIGEAKAFNNATREHVSALVAVHVPMKGHEGSRFVSVNSSAVA